MISRRLLLAGLLTAGLAAPLASAHQQKAAITTVSANPRTGVLEVAHRFLLHDAEHALQERGMVGADIVLDPAVQEAFADYVVGRFSLTLPDGQPVALTLLGYEIERGAFWIYQEGAALPVGVAQLAVESGGLRDVWDMQTNTVNFDLGGKVRSLAFTGADTVKVVNLAD